MTIQIGTPPAPPVDPSGGLESGSNGLKIKDASLAPVMFGATIPPWVKLETITVTASTSNSTSASFAGYSKIMFIWKLERTTGTGAQALSIRFNADGGANYYYITINNVTVASGAAQTQAIIGSTMDQTQNSGLLIMPRTSSGNGEHMTSILVNAGIYQPAAGTYIPQSLAWYPGAANAAITAATFISAAACTGTVEVWGQV